MPKLNHQNPSYRKHRASGQAIVTIGGRDIYLGPYGTKASKAEYDRIVSEWLANGRRPAGSVANAAALSRPVLGRIRSACRRGRELLLPARRRQFCVF